MAINAKNRQQKKARKQQKRREKLKDKQKQHVKQLQQQREYRHLTTDVEVANTEIIESSISSNLFESGIGIATLSRRLPDRRIAYAYFLLDVYCLGIKDCYGYIGHPAAYRAHCHALDSNPLHTIQMSQTPAYVCKLVYSTEAYARNIGFSPASNYHNARHIFAGIDPETCTENFTFGNHGRPLYIAGPHDSLRKIRDIIGTLKHHLGKDGFEYMLSLEAMDYIDELEDFVEEEEIEEEQG